MSMKLFELKQQHAHALKKADGILATADNAGRKLTEAEEADIQTCVTAARTLSSDIKKREAGAHLADYLPGKTTKSVVLIEGGRQFSIPGRPMLSQDYAEDFYSYIRSNGQTVGATMYEGSAPGGGYAVPSMVDDQIVPLAPNEMAVRRLATIMPTAMDMKIPQKGAFSTATAKAENNAFTESDPTLSQITLSAFMAGIQETISWELAQDVPSFQAFCVDDMTIAQQMLEEAKYITGSGTGEAQGLIGNVGAGVTEEPDTDGNLVTIDGTLNLVGKLNAVYHPGAAWLMQRSTSIALRKAQRQANLFEPVFTRVGGQDYLHGYPVEYSASMPTAERGAAPILFGDFKRGYVIGDRGGSGINIKVLDQPKATLGQIVLLAYRRTDGRVRRSEAIQQYNIAAS